MVVSEPTMSGKSTFVHNVLHDKDIFSSPPGTVYWFHGGDSDIGLEGRGYVVKQGLPDSFTDIPEGSVVVLDDLMDEAKDHPGVTALFTKLVHHKWLFVINITQNVFLNSKDTRTRRLNSQYMALFKNPSDVTQIHTIGRQMYPGSGGFMACANANATKHPYGYLFIDLRQETPNELRVRTHVLKHEFPLKIYKQPIDLARMILENE